MTESDQQQEITALTQRLLKKSIEASRLFWEEAAGRAAGVVSGQDTLKDWQRLGAKFWVDAYGDVAKMYIHYAENVVDYGINLVQELQRERTGEQPAATGGKVQPAVLHLSGMAGNSVDSSFALNSSEQQPQSGRFRLSPFFEEYSGAKSDIDFTIDPPSFEIPAGESLTFLLKVQIPESVSAGRYRSQVIVEGFSGSRFDILLDVKPKSGNVPPSDHPAEESNEDQ